MIAVLLGYLFAGVFCWTVVGWGVGVVIFPDDFYKIGTRRMKRCLFWAGPGIWIMYLLLTEDKNRCKRFRTWLISEPAKPMPWSKPVSDFTPACTAALVELHQNPIDGKLFSDYVRKRAEAGYITYNQYTFLLDFHLEKGLNKYKEQT